MDVSGGTEAKAGRLSTEISDNSKSGTGQNRSIIERTLIPALEHIMRSTATARKSEAGFRKALDKMHWHMKSAHDLVIEAKGSIMQYIEDNDIDYCTEVEVLRSLDEALEKLDDAGSQLEDATVLSECSYDDLDTVDGHLEESEARLMESKSYLEEAEDALIEQQQHQQQEEEKVRGNDKVKMETDREIKDEMKAEMDVEGEDIAKVKMEVDNHC